MMNISAESKLAYTVDETRKATGLGKTTIYALVKAGKLKPIYLGGRTLFGADDLKALLDQHKAA